MNDDDFDADDETRRQLHAIDPARSLAPADADALALILEDTMSQPQNTPTTEPARNVRRLALLGGAAAAVLAIAVGVGISLANKTDTIDTAIDTTDRPVTTTKLTTGPGISAKCMAPSSENVAAQEIAFEGKVVKVADGVVTLAVTQFYKGTATRVVEVAEPDLGMSELPVDFQVGETYLVGATDRQVSICGLSGLATNDLRALYDAAFPK